MAPLPLQRAWPGRKPVRRSTRRRSLFDAQDKIDEQRTALIAEIEEKLEQKIDLESLFTIRWRLK